METKRTKQLKILAFLLLCSLCAAICTALSAQRYGPGITHDSAAYIYAAQSLLRGEGFQYFGYPSPFIQWPPLYPALLALGEWLGFTAGSASVLINSVAYALIVLTAGRWMFQSFRFALPAVCGTLLLLFSVPLLQVSRQVWTETLFVLFFLLFFLEFERFFQHGGYRSLLAAALFAALACLERYAGVTIIAVACLFLLFRQKAFLKRLADAVLFGVLSAVPMGIWVIRNYIVSGTLLGVRTPSTFPLALNIKRAVKSIYTWVLPDSLLAGHIPALMITGLKAFAVFIPILAALTFLGMFIPKKSGLLKYQTASKYRMKSCDLPILFFIAFTIFYILYLVASATSVAFEPINSRYLVPVYLPVLLGILMAADELCGAVEGKNGREEKAGRDGRTGGGRRTGWGIHMARYAIYLLLALYLVYPALNTAATVLDSYRNGAGGYASTMWQQKSGFKKFMQMDGKTAYFSNCADAVYALSGIRTYSPPKKSGPYMYGLGQFKAVVAGSESTVLIWFDGGVPQTLYSLDELGRMYGLEKTGRFNGGTVYKLIK